MNEHLRQRAVELFSSCEQVLLVTCGPAGPQVSQVASQVRNEHLILLVECISDHLFNLEIQREVAVLSPAWELHGIAQVMQADAGVPVQPWQVAIKVRPARLHVLDADHTTRIETIDF